MRLRIAVFKPIRGCALCAAARSTALHGAGRPPLQKFPQGPRPGSPSSTPRRHGNSYNCKPFPVQTLLRYVCYTMNSHHFPDVSQLKLPCVDILSKMDCFSVLPWRKLSWRFIRFLGWICSIPTKSYHPVHPGQTSSYLAVAFCAYHPCSILFICVHKYLQYLTCVYIYINIIHCIMCIYIYILYISSICGQSISKYSTYCYIIHVEFVE